MTFLDHDLCLILLNFVSLSSHSPNLVCRFFHCNLFRTWSHRRCSSSLVTQVIQSQTSTTFVPCPWTNHGWSELPLCLGSWSPTSSQVFGFGCRSAQHKSRSVLQPLWLALVQKASIDSHRGYKTGHEWFETWHCCQNSRDVSFFFKILTTFMSQFFVENFLVFHYFFTVITIHFSSCLESWFPFQYHSFYGRKHLYPRSLLHSSFVSWLSHIQHSWSILSIIVLGKNLTTVQSNLVTILSCRWCYWEKDTTIFIMFSPSILQHQSWNTISIQPNCSLNSWLKLVKLMTWNEQVNGAFKEWRKKFHSKNLVRNLMFFAALKNSVWQVIREWKKEQVHIVVGCYLLRFPCRLTTQTFTEKGRRKWET